MATKGFEPLDIRASTEEELRRRIASFRDCEKLYEETNEYGKMNYGLCGFARARSLVDALEFVLDTAGYPPTRPGGR